MGLIKRFIEDGHEVFLLSPRDEHVNHLEDTGAKFVELKQMSAKGVNPISDIKCYKELKQILAHLKPDIIFHYTIKPNIYCSLIASSLQIRSVGIVTGLGYTFINKGIVPFIGRLLYRFSLSKSDEVWFLNSEDLKTMVTKGIVPKHKTSILNGEGIDTKRFAPSNKLNRNNNEFLFVGRILYDKGIKEYYEAARELKKEFPLIKISVLGYLHDENPMAVNRIEFDQWVNNGFIHYYGSKEDVREYMLSCSCVVLPSYREGLSMVLLEAASMGCPIITSNIAGCKEVVDDSETGFLTRVRDSKDLAEKMKKFYLLSISEKLNMGIRARNRVQNIFSIEQAYNKYKLSLETNCNSKK